VSVVGVCKWRMRWEGSFGDPFAAFGYIISDSQWWNILVPQNIGVPNALAVGYNLFPAPGGWHYQYTDTLVLPNTWYDFELKMISPGRTAWLKVDGVLDANGPFGVGTDPQDTRGYTDGTIAAQPKAPGVGALTSAPIYHDDWQMGGGDWLDMPGSAVCFTDDFETVPTPDSFVPPWENELIYGLPTDPAAEHAADPADAGNTVGKFYGTGAFIDAGCTYVVPKLTASIRGRIG
jgi:hypothetical protein